MAQLQKRGGPPRKASSDKVVAGNPKKDKKLGGVDRTSTGSTSTSSSSSTRIEQPEVLNDEKRDLTASSPVHGHNDSAYPGGSSPDAAAGADRALEEPIPLPRAHAADEDGTTTETESSSPPTPTSNSPVAPEETRTTLQTALILVSLASALFLAALDVTIVTVAVPTIAEEFHSTAGYTWIGSAYLLANAAAAPLWGKISDIWGRKPIILCATAVFWVGSLLSAVSVNMSMLIASRAVQGIGGGGIVILVNICISDLFSMRRRGVYFGVMGLVWAVAGGVGPIIGGVFTTKVTWRWCFYVNLPISGAGMLILLFVLKLHNPRTPMRQGLKAVDWLGMVTIVGGTLMFLLGLEFGGVTYPWTSPTVLCLIIFGVLTCALFVVIEWKVAKYPIIPMRLFLIRSNMAALAVCMCHGFVFISASYYLPLYFQAVLGVTPLLSGVYVLPFTLSLALVSSATGIIIRKTGKYLPCIIFGMTVMTAGFGLFTDLGATVSWPKLIAYQLVAGIGVGPNFQSPLIALQTTVEQRDIASATATFAFLRQLATAISVVIGGVVFQNGMQKQYPTLLQQLGPETAALLTGSNAGASVGAVAKISGHAGEVARGAYWTSLRTMYIMYAAFAGLGLVLSFFVGSNMLSKEHHETKTGLQAMEEARRDRKVVKSDEETAGVGGVLSAGEEEARKEEGR